MKRVTYELFEKGGKNDMARWEPREKIFETKEERDMWIKRIGGLIMVREVRIHP